MQEARLQVANSDLAKAQATLDAKQRELDEVQAQFDAAMAEKQVRACHLPPTCWEVSAGCCSSVGVT